MPKGSHSNDSKTDFVNGENVHFDYTASPSAGPDSLATPRPRGPTLPPPKSSTTEASRQLQYKVLNATINNPDDEYPSSRVIKQNPNGDVVVERLSQENDHFSRNLQEIPKPPSVHQPPRPRSRETQKVLDMQSSLWNNASLEEQENLKNFWDSLDDELKLKLVKIEKKPIMELFRSETKAYHLDQLLQSSLNRQNQGQQGGSNRFSSGNTSSSQSSSVTTGAKLSPHEQCTCHFCGRRSNVIEEELENVYENHFDDILGFIHELRDVNDVNALPGLLFGGFNMLESEHRQFKQKQVENISAKPRELPPTALYANPAMPPPKIPFTKKSPAEPQLLDFKSKPAYQPSTLQPSDSTKVVDEETKAEIQREREQIQTELINLAHSCQEQKLFQTLLDPKLHDALENLDIPKLKHITRSDEAEDAVSQSLLLDKADSLRRIIREIHNPNKPFVDLIPPKGQSVDFPLESVTLLTHGLSTFAADLIKNDGSSFINMMEALTESRTVREGILEEAAAQDMAEALSLYPMNGGGSGGNHKAAATTATTTAEVAASTTKGSADDYPSIRMAQDVDMCQLIYKTAEKPSRGQLENRPEESGDEGGHVEDFDGEYDDYADDSAYSQEDGASDTESEVSEDGKMQEIRRLFLIQVIKLFQARLKKAYQEKLSQDRTQMLIQELEAEENAKKERELKKQKQKEKLKEKKRLQQLAKEEERKKKEEDLRAKEQEELEKQESLRADQKRRKEEQRLKREEEKRKRIEELKRKEEEHQKKLEAQRKREEEAKKLKEERKKKTEEERKRKEEEKKRKDLLKAQREQEREQQRLERERGHLSEQVQAAMGNNLAKLGANIKAKLPLQAPGSLEREDSGHANQKLVPNFVSENHNLRPGSIEQDVFPTCSPAPQFASILSPRSQIHVLPQGHALSQESLLYGVAGQSHSLAPTHRPEPVTTSSFSVDSPWREPSLMNSGSNRARSPSSLLQSSLLGIGSFLSPTSDKDFFGSAALKSPGIINSMDPLAGTHNNPGTASSSMGGASPSVWGQRKTSIWNQPSAGTSSGQPTPNMMAQPGQTLTNTPLQLLWGTTPMGVATTQPATFGLATEYGGTGSGGVSATSATSLHPLNSADPGNDAIQQAAYTAFLQLQSQQQLDFGAAPLHKLYRAILQFMGLTVIPLQRILNALRQPSSIPFEFTCDDFGTVTHVQIGHVRKNRSGVDLGHATGSLSNNSTMPPFGHASSPLMLRIPLHTPSLPSLTPTSQQRLALVTDHTPQDLFMRSFDNMSINNDPRGNERHSLPHDSPRLTSLQTEQQPANGFAQNRGLWN